MGNYLHRVEALELERESRDHQPKPINILHLIVDPDPTIGVVGVIVTRPEYRNFERMPGESVEDLKRRVCLAMGWNYRPGPSIDGGAPSA